MAISCMEFLVFEDFVDNNKCKASDVALIVADPFHTLQYISKESRAWRVSGATAPAAKSNGRQNGQQNECLKQSILFSTLKTF
jgi:hypothetical protein